MNDFATYLSKAMQSPGFASIAVVVLYCVVFALRYVPVIGAYMAADRLRMRVSAGVLAFAPYVIIGLSGGGWDTNGIAMAVLTFWGATGLDKLISGTKLAPLPVLMLGAFLLASCAAFEKAADDAGDLLIAGSDVSNYVDPKAQHERALESCKSDAQCIAKENELFAKCLAGLAMFRAKFCEYIGGC